MLLSPNSFLQSNLRFLPKMPAVKLCAIHLCIIIIIGGGVIHFCRAKMYTKSTVFAISWSDGLPTVANNIG